jgi:hypothetical protein
VRSSAKGLISAHLLLALACASSPATPAARGVAADAPRSSGVDGAEVREVQLTVTDMMVAYAQDAVDHAQSSAGVTLDYSPDSIKSVEEILEKLYAAVPRGF